MLKIDAKSVSKLVEASKAVEAIFEEIYKAREEAEATFARLLEELGEAKEEAREVLDDAAMDAESYHDEKSEKWQEGDRGQAYQEWAQRLRELADAAAEDIEVPDIPEFERPEWVADCIEADFAEFEFEG